MDLLKKLLDLDPNKRISAKHALDHEYFDCYKSRRQKSPSVNQRVLSSTYRTTYTKMEKSSQEKRAPSYSQGRRKQKKYKEKGRSESRGNNRKDDFLGRSSKNSTSFLMSVNNTGHGFYNKKKKSSNKQKLQNVSRRDFAIYTQSNFQKSRRDDRDERMSIGLDTPDSNSHIRRRNGSKKSKHNFKMFRISKFLQKIGS